MSTTKAAGNAERTHRFHVRTPEGVAFSYRRR
jgi:hypothetical protein